VAAPAAAAQVSAHGEVEQMQAAVGDRLHMHSNMVGQPERTARIVEVRGAGGEPPYLVKFDDGDTSLVFPGPDAVIERRRGRKKD